MERKTVSAGRKRYLKSLPKKGSKRPKVTSSNARGFSAIACCCNQAKERETIKDLLNVLHEFADQLYPEEEKEHKSCTAQDGLEAEILAMKKESNNGSSGRFQPLDTGVKGYVLIKLLDPKMNAIALVKSILEQVHRTKESVSRYIIRLLPLEMIAASTVDNIEKQVKVLLEKRLEGFKNSNTFGIALKQRQIKLEKDDIIAKCAALFPKEYKVNLSNPDVTLLIEVFCTSFGISLLSDYGAMKKYNVQGLLEDP